MLTNVANRRRAFVESAIDCTSLSILEFGAFDNPTFRREMGDDVRYVDYFTRSELKEMHRNNPRRRFEMIVEVDFVIKSHVFADKIDRDFDLLAANHVIEHIPDVVLWLQQLQQILAEGGRVFLSLPDRRYTFDYFRPVSLATQMIRAHEERLERADKWQLAEHFYYHQKVDQRALWEGRSPGDFRPRFDLKTALEMADRKSRQYEDAHCWVFTPESFRQCITDLRSANLITLSILTMQETQKHSNEFRVILGSD